MSPHRSNGPWMNTPHGAPPAGSGDARPAGWRSVGSDLARAPSSVNIDLSVARWVACGHRTMVIVSVGVQVKITLLAGCFQCFGHGMAWASRPMGVARMTDFCGDISSLGSAPPTSRLGPAWRQVKSGAYDTVRKTVRAQSGRLKRNQGSELPAGEVN